MFSSIRRFLNWICKLPPTVVGIIQGPPREFLSKLLHADASPQVSCLQCCSRSCSCFCRSFSVSSSSSKASPVGALSSARQAFALVFAVRLLLTSSSQLWSRFWLFQVIHGFLIVAFGSGLPDALKGLDAKTVGDLPNKLAVSLPKSSIFCQWYSMTTKATALTTFP